jgi:methyl coenzyme M reductase subunit C-like uncharacterized protein (methanogenesis marker protein 7)
MDVIEYLECIDIKQEVKDQLEILTNVTSGPTRVDIAQLPVAHAQNILQDRVLD